LYSLHEGIKEIKKLEAEGKANKDAEVLKRNKENLENNVKGLYGYSKEYKQFKKDLTKSKSTTELYEVLDKFIEEQRKIDPEKVLDVDKPSYYNSLIDLEILAAKYAPSNRVRLDHVAKAEKLVSGFDKEFGLTDATNTIAEIEAEIADLNDQYKTDKEQDMIEK